MQARGRIPLPASTRLLRGACSSSRRSAQRNLINDRPIRLVHRLSQPRQREGRSHSDGRVRRRASHGNLVVKAELHGFASTHSGQRRDKDELARRAIVTAHGQARRSPTCASHRRLYSADVLAVWGQTKPRRNCHTDTATFRVNLGKCSTQRMGSVEDDRGSRNIALDNQAPDDCRGTGPQPIGGSDPVQGLRMHLEAQSRPG